MGHGAASGEMWEVRARKDPRLALILVDADSVLYLKHDRPRPVVLFEVAKGMVTGTRPDVGEVRRVEM